MEYKRGLRYVISSDNDSDKCICHFVGKVGESYRFKVIGSVSYEERLKYDINTCYKEGKILKFDYDEIISGDNIVSIYLIS